MAFGGVDASIVGSAPRAYAYAVTKHDSLFWLHIAGAILLLAGVVLAGALNLTALTRERPSEIARLLGRTRIAVVVISLGMLITLVVGLWLVHDENRSYGQGWIVAALVLWVVANALGGLGGKRDRKTRQFAEQLAAQG